MRVRSSLDSQPAIAAAAPAEHASAHHHNETRSDGDGNRLGATKPATSAAVVTFANADAIAYHVANSTRRRIHGRPIGIAREQARGETRRQTRDARAGRVPRASRFVGASRLGEKPRT